MVAGAAQSLTGTLASPAAATALRAEADQAVREMHQTQYCSLVRLTTLLTGDTQAAEQVVQDSFVDMHRSWSRLRSQDRALGYLRRSVVIRSRAVPRSPDDAARPAEADAIVAAIWQLPPRQREAVVFRFYLGLPEGQIASAMGISPGAVRAYTARAVAALERAQ